MSNTGKVFAVLLFYEAEELGIQTDSPTGWICRSVMYSTNYIAAMETYANTPCPASQLLEANTTEELQAKVEQMKLNYQNNEWLNTHLYPFL